jgi:hypothetical protein
MYLFFRIDQTILHLFFFLCEVIVEKPLFIYICCTNVYEIHINRITNCTGNATDWKMIAAYIPAND